MEREKKRYSIKNWIPENIGTRLLVLTLIITMTIQFSTSTMAGRVYAADTGSEEVQTEARDWETSSEGDPGEQEAVPAAASKPEFSKSELVDNSLIFVYAPEGVFPEGAELSVKELPKDEQKEADSAVAKVRDSEREIAASHTFDIKVLDKDGVTELEPEEGSKVLVFFSMDEMSKEDLKADIYSVAEDEKTGETDAEKEELLTKEALMEAAKKAAFPCDPETTLALETDGLEYYTVIFEKNEQEEESANEQEEESSDEQEEDSSDEQEEKPSDEQEEKPSDEQEEEPSEEQETETGQEVNTAGYPAFSPEEVEIDGVRISVSAPEGVFPEGAVLSVKKVTKAEQETADAAVEEMRDADTMVVASYTFDIKVLDKDGVTELEPVDKAMVKVSFSLSEAADQNLDTDVYHITEDASTGELSAEKLEADGSGTTVVVETDGFSYYTVEFTYGRMQYVLQGDSSVPMSEILSAVGLTGEVTAAEVSNDTLFTASNESGEWIVTALEPFLSEEWMKVTINDVVYEIAVKDDPGDVMLNAAYLDCTVEDGVVRWEVRTHSAKQVPSNGAMTSGWYYLDNNVTVDGRVSINGDTYLILGTGNKLDVKGFYVPKGSTLTIYSQSAGNGRLYSHPSGGAAIGAYADHKGGNIVIYGGKIEAYGHDHCAGIGSNDDDRKDVGSITIYGGDITAEGGNSGAGIGGGRASEGGNITIYGGTIHATGGHYGAGIGGGNGQDTNPMRGAHGGNITIYGGDITAKGGDDGAGIGGGEGGNAGTIVINGGTVNATGGNNSAGIGTGEGESTGVGGTVTINGGNVTAWGGGDAAGIGGGEDANCDTITINGGTVNATGGGNGAGIGAGRNADGGHIIITGGDVTAEGKDSSAGIGGADPSGSYEDHTSIEISGGTIRATGNSKGAGIGGGEYGHATIFITGGDITAKGGSSGGAGIGNGKDGSGSAIVLDYTEETAEDISITVERGSYKGTVTLLKPFKNGSENFRETGSVSDLDKLVKDPPLVAWTDAEPIAREVEVNSWAELQAEIDDGSANEKKITLKGDISAESGDTRIVIPKDKNITIDLNGFTMNRQLTNASVSDNGSVIHVAKGAALTVTDSSSAGAGTITGGHSTRGGGILNEGTLTIKGGTIAGNKASVSGGSNGTGGGIYNAGTLTVNGGSISGNTAATWGGGIYLADGTGSTLNLNGGEITGNTCGNNGGGVHVSSSAFMNISGEPAVRNNTKGSEANNVNLADGTFLHVTGSLKEGAEIGMHMSYPTSGNITSGLKGRGTAANFVSDDPNYEVRIDGKGEAYLYKDPTYTVDSWDALQAAVDAAQDGDIIRLDGPDGEVKRTGSRTRIQVRGNKRITIDLAGNKLNRDLDTDHDDGQVIEVFSGATLTIRDSVGGGLITRGYAKRGGGICIDEGATCIITGGTITGNRATDDGGGIYVWGTLKMAGGAITQNSAEDNGGGLFVAESGRIDLTGADISYNTAEDDGGAIKTYSEGDARITDCTITNNKTNDKYGGGILMDMSGKTMTITDTRIDHNSSDDDGGGIYLRKGTIVMNGGSVSENWSYRDSGGVRVEAKTTFTATGVTIHKNTSDTEEGGGLKNYGTTTLTNCVISSNKSKKQGGGLYNDDADGGAGVLNVYGCTVFGNTSQDNGGGIYSDYKLTVIGGSVTGNISNKSGGGIFIGDDSKDTNIGGDLVVKDNGAAGEGKDIFLRTKRLVVQEKLLDGAMIGITKENDGGLGEFTKGYPTKNGTDDPSLYFFSPEGFGIRRASGTNEAELGSGWKELRQEILNNCVDTGQAALTVTLDHDYAAGPDDKALEVPEGKKVIIDLNGYTLNRNLSSEGKAGHVIRVRDDAELTLIDSTATETEPGSGTITGGYSEHGGGINIGDDATLIARGINVTGNKADDDGGGVYINDGGTLRMENCLVSGNVAEDNGGGIFTGENASLVVLENVSVLGNYCSNDGAGMKLWLGGDSRIKDCVFSGNSAHDHGGGMYIEAKDSTLRIENTTIDNNTAKDDGAGILLQTGRIEMYGGSVSGNTTDNDGGGVKVTNKTEFYAEGVVISNNTAKTEQGGGLKSHGEATLKGCTISGNYAGDCGGGLFNDKYEDGSKGKMTIENCRIYDNSTAGTGGGIWNNYELTLKGDNLIGAVPAEGEEEGLPGNSAEGSGGGGIYFRGDEGFIKIEGCLTATGNKASIGDDIYLKRGKKLVLTGPITGTNVGEIDLTSTGVFTENYSKYHPYDPADETKNHPSNFFGTNEEAMKAEWNDAHTEAVLNSFWPDLQALIDAAAAGQSMEEYEHPETADGLVVLEKNYIAGSNDTRLKIKDGYDVIVDLNGYILDRNLISKTDNGQIFEIFGGGTLTLRDSAAEEDDEKAGAITGGYTGWGGAIYINSGGTLNMESGLIVGNNAEKSGGAIYNMGTLNMTGGILTGNAASEYGGAVCSGEGSSLSIENVLIYSNTAADYGGGLYLYKINKGHATLIKNCTIYENNCVDYGAGLYMDSPGTTLTIEDTTIDRNLSGDDGAGIYLNGGSIDMTGGSVSGNGSVWDAGGIRVNRDTFFTADGVEIKNNKALKEDGGGIKNYGTSTLKNCMISGNSAEREGGGVFNTADIRIVFRPGNPENMYDISAGELTLENCIIKDNSSHSSGGGVYSNKNLIIKDGTITENTAADKGGGVFLGGDSQNTLIEGAPVIRDNKASGFGDDLYVRSGKLELTGPLTEDADIHVDLENGTGVLTKGYKAQNGTDDPKDYFTIAVGYETRFTGDGEVEIISGWNTLKKKIENANSGSIIILDKDYAAADPDDRIKIENKNITIDLNGYTLNRRRKDKVSDGHVLEVFDGAALTIKDSSEDQTGTITGAWSHEGGIFVNSNATLNLQGGTITGNRAGVNGGGIYANGTVNMIGGTVAANKTDGSGGGICMVGNGTLTLEGGVITGNEAGNKGGGVMINSGTTVTVKRNPAVFANRAPDGNDIYLSEGTMPEVTGAFTEGARLGVAREEGKGRITTNYSAYNGEADPAKIFVSTDGYGVYLKNGEAVLEKMKTYGETEYMDPFISWNNQITDSDALSNQNWMAGISGDRYLQEINTPGSHDSGMNNVDEKYDGDAQMIAQIIGIGTAVIGIIGGAIAFALSPVTAGTTAIAGSYLMSIGVTAALATLWTNLSVPTDWTAFASDLADGRAADMAKTQKQYIDEQLRSGARQLDIRLGCRYKDYKWYVNGYLWEDDGRNLWLCHGKKAGGTYLAEDHESDYLSFSQVIEWVKEFLEEHPTETILFDLRPETMDSSNFPTIYERTRTILEDTAMQINPSTGEPFLYKEPGSDDFFAPYTHMPKLADCRGKIVLMPENGDYINMVGGFNLGSLTTENVDEMDYQNTASEMVEQAQVVYGSVNGDGHVMLPAEVGAEDFDRLWYWELNCTGEHSGVMNYVSGDTPHVNAEYVNPRVVGSGKTFDPEKAGQYIGWVRMDSFEAYYSEQIWRTNFFDGLQYCTVTVKSGLNDPNYPDQIYKLLKGTKIDIPGNIYKQLGEGQYFDCWTTEDGTGYNLGDTFKVDEDVTFTAKWLEEGRIPVQVVWKDGNDADDLRPESVKLNVTAGTGTTTVTLTGDQDWRTVLTLTGEVTDVVPDWDLAEGQYTYTYTFEKGTGHVVTFIHTPDRKISVTGAVRWKGDDSDDDGEAEDRPESVTIHLWRGEEVITSQGVSADEDGYWTFDFGEQPQYVDGEKVEYSITETMDEASAKFYDISIDGFTVTNTYIPEDVEMASIIGVVEWDDADNEKELRPETVRIVLKADGEETGSLNATQREYGGWAWTFGEVPFKNANGGRIAYTIEPEEIEGYSMTWEPVTSEADDPAGEGTVPMGQNIYLFKVTYTLDVPEDEKTPASIEEMPKAGNPVYSGEPQALIERGSASGGTLVYALGDSKDTAPEISAFSTEIPEGTDAGPYHVWYYVKGDAMHMDTDPVCMEDVSIRKAPQKIKAEDVEMASNDDGRKVEASVTGVGESTEGLGALSFEVTDGADVVGVDTETGALTPISDGTATVTVTAAETDNYSKTTLEVTVTVKPAKYTLTFYEDTEGTVIYNKYTLYDGTSLNGYANYGKESPYVMERPGYFFAGWATKAGVTVDYYNSREGLNPELEGKIFNFNREITENLDAYPIWIRDHLDVILDTGAPDGEVTMDEEQELMISMNIDDKIAMRSLVKAKREGYELSGWYTKEGVLWNGDEWKTLDYSETGSETAGWDVTPEYCNKDENGDTIKEVNLLGRYNYYTITLTARWEQGQKKAGIEYIVGEDGTGEITDENTYILGDVITLGGAPKANEGKTFTGWMIDGDDTLYSAEGTFTFSDWSLVKNGKLTFTAQYIDTPVYVAVTFDSKGGTAVEPIEVLKGQKIGEEPGTTKDGYTFLGWFNEEESETARVIFPFEPEGNVTLTAHWKANKYTITFDSAGGSAVESITEDYGAPVTAPEDPTKLHYEFDGWYPSLPETMPLGGLEVTATWKPAVYSITFDKGNGSEVEKVEGIYGSVVEEPKAPEKDGYVFKGWLDEDGEAVSFPIYMPDTDPTYTAKWKSVQDAPEINAEAVDPYTVKVTDSAEGAEYIIVPKGQEPGPKDWAAAKTGDGGDLMFEDLEPNTEYEVWARMPETEDAAQSDAARAEVTTNKEKADTPSAPAVEATDAHTVTVKNADDSQEYVIVPKGNPVPDADSDSWKSPDENGAVTWTGLEPNTEYEVYTRVKETDEKDASDPSAPAAVKTPGLIPEGGAPEAKDGLTFTGIEQALVTAGSIEGGTTEYAIGPDGETPPEDGWSTDVPEAKDAGNYHVWWRVTGDDQHEDLDPECIDVTIAKADQKITSKGKVSGEVGESGKAIEASVAGIGGAADGVGTLSFAVTEGSDVVRVNAETGELELLKPGTAKVTVTAKETDNYNAASIVVTVTVKAATRTLTFYEDTEGTVIWKSIQLNYGTSLDEYAEYGTAPPDEITKTGYTFAGWATKAGVTADYYNSREGLNPELEGKIFNFNREITEDLDAYPIWIRDCLEVNLIAGDDEQTPVTWGIGFDGKVQSAHFYVDINEKLHMEGLNSTTREGYELDGWYTQGGVKWDESGTWGVTPEYCDKDGSGKPIIKKDIPGRYKYYTVTLTARWTPKAVGVEYIVGEDGTGEITDENTYTLGDVITLGGAPKANEGKTFTGWMIDGDDTLYSAEGTFTFSDWSLVKNGKLTFAAQYIDTPVYVAVTFDSKGGTAVEPIEVQKGRKIEEEPKTTKDGYTFLGWFNEEEIETARVIFPFEPEGNVTLTAHWKANKYTITFDSAGGSAVESITEEYGAPVTAPEDPTKLHYEFDGWYPTLPETMPLGGLEVTATWKPAVYSITFDKGNGSETLIVEGIYGSTVVEPEAPENDGYVFRGWLDEDGEAVSFPIYMPDTDPTYTAKWKSVQEPPAINAETVDPYTVKVMDSVDGAEYIIVPKGQEPGPKDWAAAKTGDGGDITFDDLTPNTEYDVWARMPETEDKAESEAAKKTVTTNKEKADAPQAPSAEATDASTVTVKNADESQEYVIVPKGVPAPDPDSDSWKSPDENGAVTWTRLEPNTEYDVYARVKETSDKTASDPSEPASVRTPGLIPEGEAPEAKDGLTFTGIEQALITAGSIEGGTTEYAIGPDDETPPEDGWSTDVPEAKDAGNYHVWWRVTGDKQHEDLDPECIDVTIAKADQNISGTESISGGVGESGKAIEASVTGVGDTTDGVGTLSYEVTEGSDVVSVDAETGALTFKKAGTATIKVTAAETDNYNRAEIEITITVTDKEETEISYFNTEGEGTVWTKGSGKTADFTFKRSVNDSTTLSHFKGISVDGTTVDTTNYTAESGSVIVKLKPAYLETLSVGEHTLTADFNDANDVTVDFRIVESGSPEDPGDGGDDVTPEDAHDGSQDKGKSVKTGDESNITLWLLLMCASIAALLKLQDNRRKKIRK